MIENQAVKFDEQQVNKDIFKICTGREQKSKYKKQSEEILREIFNGS